MKTFRTVVCVAAVLAIGAWSFGAPVVVPNKYKNFTDGNGLNSPIRQAPNERTLVMQMPGKELGLTPGVLITGINFRMWQRGAVWPPRDANFATYDMYVGDSAVADGAMVASVAANYKPGTKTQVFKGKLTVPRGNYQLGSPIHPFGKQPWMFQTPYKYNGGTILIELTHKGNDTGTTQYLDFARNWKPGTKYMGYNIGYKATTLKYFYGGPMVTAVHWIPEPATLALLGLCLLVRRR